MSRILEMHRFFSEEIVEDIISLRKSLNDFDYN